MDKKRVEDKKSPNIEEIDKLLSDSVMYQQAKANALNIPLQMPQGVKILEDHVAISTTTTIPCYRIVPEDKRIRFTMFYIPGTAFAKHHPKQNAIVCAHLSLVLECEIIIIHHRLYESNKYPIPYNDCIGVINYYLDNAVRLHIDRRKVALAGYSSGGLIALQICLATLRTGQTLIPFQQLLLFAPIVDLRENKPQSAYNMNELTGNRAYRDQCRSALIPALLDEGSPAFSPMNCQREVFQHFPKTTIIYGTNDSYANDIELFNTECLSISSIPGQIVAVQGLKADHYFHWQLHPGAYLNTNLVSQIKNYQSEYHERIATEDRGIKVKKFLTAEQVKEIVFTHLRQSASYRQITLFENRVYTIDQHFVHPILKRISIGQQTENSNVANQLLEPGFFNAFPRILIKASLNQQKILLFWLCQQALNVRAPTFIFLPLEELINSSFVHDFSLAELIQYFYKEINFNEMAYGYETNSDMIFIVHGLSALQKNDSFNMVKQALQQLLQRKVIFLDEEEPLFELNVLCDRLIVENFHILPRSVVHDISGGNAHNPDDYQTFSRLIGQGLLNTTNGRAAVGSFQPLRPSVNAMDLLNRYVIALNNNFTNDSFNPVNVSRARILIKAVLDVMHFYSKYKANNSIIFELLLKCINFHLQVDSLNIDPDLLAYCGALAQQNRHNVQMHSFVTQYYQMCVRYANARRAEPEEYKELIAAIADFIQNAGPGKYPDLEHSLAIAYMQADEPESSVAELSKLVKTPYVTSSPKKQLTVYANLSTAYQILKQYKKAITYLMMVVHVHKNTSTHDPNIGFTYNALGAIYLDLKEFSKAVYFYRQSIAESAFYHNRNQYHRFAGWAHFGLARIMCMYSHNRIAATKQRDDFVEDIRVIFPNSWPKSYLDCLQNINGDITSLSIPHEITPLDEEQEASETPPIIQAKL